MMISLALRCVDVLLQEIVVGLAGGLPLLEFFLGNSQGVHDCRLELFVRRFGQGLAVEPHRVGLLAGVIGAVAPRVEHLGQVLALRIVLQQRVERGGGGLVLLGGLIGRFDFRAFELGESEIEIGVLQQFESAAPP